MNLLFICHQFLPEHIGGTELYTWGLASRALALNWNVLVVSYVESPSGDPADFHVTWDAYDAIPLAKIHFNLSLARQPVLAEYANEEISPFLEEIWQRFKPDVIHHTHSMKVSGFALRFFARKGIPSVLTMPDFWYICPRHTLVKWDHSLCTGPRSPYQCAKCLHHTHGFLPDKIADWSSTKITAYLFSHEFLPSPPASESIKKDARALRKRKQYLLETAFQADRILVLSAFQQKMLIENGYDPNRLTLTPHGLETEGLHIQPKKDSGKNKNLQLTFIGSIVPHKGLHTLMEALAAADNPYLTLKIYGGMDQPTPYQDQIRQQAQTMDQVELAGTFPMKEMNKILDQTDVLVMPAEWYENEPLVIKSALYCRIPVMSSDIGSLREMITPGVTGWLLPPADQRAWAKALADLSPENLPDFSEVTYQIFSMDTYFSDLVSIYNELSHANN